LSKVQEGDRCRPAPACSAAGIATVIGAKLSSQQLAIPAHASLLDTRK